MRSLYAALAAVTFAAAPARAHEDGEPHTHDAPAPPASGYAAPPEPAPGYSDPSDAGVEGEAVVEGETEAAPAPAPSSRAVPPPLEADQGAGSYRRRTIDDHDWRTRSRPDDSSSNEFTDFTHFYFELRFGPYSPEVDEEFDGCSGDGCPYARFFGEDPLFYFGLELDWLPLYIPYVVSIGPGFGWGVTSASGKARTQDGAEAGSDTGLTIFPMHVSAVARFDGPLREAYFPVVPYVKAGLGIGLWTASGPNEESASVTRSPEGTSLGLHLALGGAIALNAFDPQAAMAMKENTGISYANLWAEWMWANLDGIGSTPAMHVGTSTVVLGLALDF